MAADPGFAKIAIMDLRTGIELMLQEIEALQGDEVAAFFGKQLPGFRKLAGHQQRDRFAANRATLFEDATILPGFDFEKDGHGWPIVVITQAQLKAVLDAIDAGLENP